MQDFAVRPPQELTPVDPDLKPNPEKTYGHWLRISALYQEDSDKYLDKEIKVCGWNKNLREAEKGALLFIELYDGSIFNSI